MKAVLKNYRQSPRKVRLVADLVRGKAVDRALVVLHAAEKRASLPVRKLIESAVANARANEDVRPDQLFVKDIRVDKGYTFKRAMPRARGAASPINRRSSHISIVLTREDKGVKSKKRT